MSDETHSETDPLWAAERTLVAVLPDGSEADVYVRIGLPRPRDPAGEFWYTPYKIEGAGRSEANEVFGIGDSLNSLNATIVHVGLRLLVYGEQGIKLSWLGKSDLRFPKPY